jgi:hypothetical protein
MARDKRVVTFSVFIGIFIRLLFSFYSEAPFLFVDVLKLSYSAYGRLGLLLAAASFCGAMSSRYFSRLLAPSCLVQTGCVLALLISVSLIGVAALGRIETQSVFLATAKLIFPFMGVFFCTSLVIPSVLSQALEGCGDCLGREGSLFRLSYYLIIALITFGMGNLHDGKVQTLPWFFVFLTISMNLACYLYYKIAVVEKG